MGKDNYSNTKCICPKCKKYCKKNNLIESLFCVENFLCSSQKACNIYKLYCLFNFFFR